MHQPRRWTKNNSEKIEHDWADAYVKRDTAFRSKITADDFAFVGPDGNIVKRMAYVKHDWRYHIRRVKLENLNVRFMETRLGHHWTCAIKAQSQGRR